MVSGKRVTVLVVISVILIIVLVSSQTQTNYNTDPRTKLEAEIKSTVPRIVKEIDPSSMPCLGENSGQYLVSLEKAIGDVGGLLKDIKAAGLESEWQRTNQSLTKSITVLLIAHDNYQKSMESTGGLLGGFINTAYCDQTRIFVNRAIDDLKTAVDSIPEKG